MFCTTLAAVALLGQVVSAQNMLRFACSQLTTERADPLVNPGLSPSPHTHQIVGGNSFNLTLRIVHNLRREILLTWLRWNQVPMTRPPSRPAPPARTLRISATIGLPLCTSDRLIMALSRRSLNMRMAGSRRTEA